MNDEDFVMGYAVGFNDGVGSGSGGGLDDMTFLKKYRLIGTEWSIGLNDGYYKTEEAFTVYSESADVGLNENSFSPYPLYTNHELLFVVLKNNSVVGMVPLTKYTRYYKGMSRDANGVWNFSDGYETRIEGSQISLVDSTSPAGKQELYCSWNEVRYQDGVKKSEGNRSYRMVSRDFTNGICTYVSPDIYTNMSSGHCMMSADILKSFLLAFGGCGGIEEITEEV